MKIKELYEIVCPTEYRNIRVEIKEFDKNKNDITSPMDFVVLDSTEEQLYANCIDKESFVGTSEFISIYDTEVEDFFLYLSEEDHSQTIELTTKKLKKYFAKVSEAYVYLSHMILHEIGHYQQYLNLNKNVFDYTSLDYAEKVGIDAEYQRMNDKIHQRIIKQGKKPVPTKGEKKLLADISRRYRRLPTEKEADDFAYSMMKETVEKIAHKQKTENKRNL